LPTRAPPETDLSALKTSTIGCSRKASFYNKHLASHLILERVVYFDTLVSTMANTVDRAIQNAVAKRPLPKKLGMLRSADQIRDDVSFLLQPTLYHETGVAKTYSHHAATYCRPIASTLALHPSFSDRWISVLDWTSDGKMGRWAIADGVLRISQNVFANDQLLQNEDKEKKGIIKQLAHDATALAVWEMKSLTVGPVQVMEEIAKMGQNPAKKFPWKKCTLPVCDHQFLENMKEASESYDRGFDPCSPSWTLPIVPSTSSVDPRPTSRRKSLRSASAQSGTTTRLSYEERFMSSVEDGEGETKKRNAPDDSEYEQPPPKKPRKSKTDLTDGSYELPTRSRKEVNAESFLQQVA
jgi:hypothetical protein